MVARGTRIFLAGGRLSIFKTFDFDFRPSLFSEGLSGWGLTHSVFTTFMKFSNKLFIAVLREFWQLFLITFLKIRGILLNNFQTFSCLLYFQNDLKVGQDAL